jgi:hypothetical protein
MAAEFITRRDASGILIKYLVTSGWVTVTGPPFSICSINSGITDPLLPRTFPKRTAAYSASFFHDSMR